MDTVTLISIIYSMTVTTIAIVLVVLQHFFFKFKLEESVKSTPSFEDLNELLDTLSKLEIKLDRDISSINTKLDELEARDFKGIEESMQNVYDSFGM